MPHPPHTGSWRSLTGLDRPAARREAGLFLVEGRRAIDALLEAGWVPQRLLVRRGEEIPAAWHGHAIEPVAVRDLERLSQASTPSGYCAAFPLPTPPPLDRAAGGLVLVGVQDPGNLGTLLRSAAAFGTRQVVLVGGADPFGHKAVQATAGALARLAIHLQVGDPALLAGGATRCALVVRDGQPPRALPAGPRWLVVGSEADGLPADWLAACEERLTLPMPGGTESLNAAVAGAIALYALGPGRG